MTAKLNVESRKVADLRPDPKNARIHSARNLAAIKASLETFGQQKPIVIKKSGEVIAGSGTLAAATELGWDSLDVVVFTGTAKQAKAFAIADNRTAELAGWDLEQLEETLRSFDSDLTVATGWSDSEIEDLFQPHQITNTESSEIDLGETIFTHKCPRCSFEFQ